MKAIVVEGGVRLGMALPPLPMGMVRLGTGSTLGLGTGEDALGADVGWATATERPGVAVGRALGDVAGSLALATVLAGGGITAMGMASPLAPEAVSEAVGVPGEF